MISRKEFLTAVTAALSSAGLKAGEPEQEVSEPLEKGALYVVTVPNFTTAERLDSARKQLNELGVRFGVQFMLVEGSATVRKADAPIINVTVNAPRDPAKWETMSLYIGFGVRIEHLEESIAVLGDEGWELVSTTDYRAWFKREKRG